MKAVQINAYGANEVLEINDNVSKPSAGEGQVLVEAYAASINPFDLAVRAGYTKEMFPLKFPATLGGDFAGVVTEAGKDSSLKQSLRSSPAQRGAGLKVGDEVYGQAILLNGGSGSFAEFAAANMANSALKPQNISFLQAASLPLAGVSALQALEDHIKLKKNQKILIHGGAGGIGSIAIQLAKAIGAYVATTVSADDVDFARKLGADEAMDYKKEDFTKKLKGFDAVFSTVGGEVVDKSFTVLKSDGIIVSMLGSPNEEFAKKHGIVAVGQNTQTNADRLSRLAKYIESGKIKPQVDKVFSLAKAKEAFEYLEKGSPRGKVVLKIK